MADKVGMFAKLFARSSACALIKRSSTAYGNASQLCVSRTQSVLLASTCRPLSTTAWKQNQPAAESSSLTAEEPSSAQFQENIQNILQDNKDMPEPDLENPYQKPQKRCILCEHKVELNYKNTRLLSQFVSSNTGRIYGRHITGLCIPMQKHVAKLIKRARYFGFMPFVLKDPSFLRDPRLFDPFKPRH